MARSRIRIIASFVAIAIAISAAISYLREPKLERAGAIEKLLPSVVRITTRSMVPDDSAGSGEARTKMQESFGSGFIIDKRGYIVTNRHVIKDAYEIIVRLNDGSPLHAQLVGHGGDIDIALLKVQTNKKLDQVKFGDSEKLSLGGEVIVIGNPFGLGTTVTSGIVSALNRDLGFSMFDSFIQTDAPINHGNSGGPIFNMKGEVIGVSTAYYTGGNAKGGSIGVGFAIPSETTQEIVALLRKYGYLRIGWLGVEGATLTPEMINGLGLKVKSGAVVANVLPGPARNILEAGDVISEINGENLEDMRMLRREAATSLGKRIKLRVLRAGRAETVSVTPAEWPAAHQTAIMSQKPPPESSGVSMDLGFECSPLNQSVRSEYNLEPAQRGVAVTAIHSNSPAADSGLQIGDVVTAVQLQPMEDPAQVKAMIKEAIAANRDYLTLLVRSRDHFKYLTLPLKWQAPVEAALAKDNG